MLVSPACAHLKLSRRRHAAVVVVAAVIFSAFMGQAAGAFHPTARCSACLSVVDELSSASAASMVGMGLDLRSGVGGSRKGKVVPWHRSETRAIEVRTLTSFR